MNWWDFLDVLKCYAESASCGLWTKCSWCRYWFCNLLGETWDLTNNSWRTQFGQFFTAVIFSPADESYRRYMTIQPHRRRCLTDIEKELIEEKEQLTIFKYIIVFKKSKTDF